MGGWRGRRGCGGPEARHQWSCWKHTEIYWCLKTCWCNRSALTVESLRAKRRVLTYNMININAQNWIVNIKGYIWIKTSFFSLQQFFYTQTEGKIQRGVFLMRRRNSWRWNSWRDAVGLESEGVCGGGLGEYAFIIALMLFVTPGFSFLAWHKHTHSCSRSGSVCR